MTATGSAVSIGSDAQFYAEQASIYEQSVKSKVEGTQLSTEIAKSEVSRAKYVKWKFLLLLFVFLCFVVLLAYELLYTWLAYMPLINDVDKYKPPEWKPSGYETALCIRYPGLSGILRYPTPALALAAMFCFFSPALRPVFLQRATVYMSDMWRYTTLGSYDVTANQRQNALTIVCQSWACAARVTYCLPPCPDDSISWLSLGMTSLSVGMAGAFLGQMAGGKAAAGSIAVKGATGTISMVAFVALASVAAVLSYFSQKHRHSDAKSQTPLCASAS